MAKKIFGPENDPFFDMREENRAAGGGRPPSGTRAGTEAPAGKHTPLSGLFFGLAASCFLCTFLTGMFGAAFLEDYHAEWLLPCMFGCIFLFAGLGALCTKGPRLMALPFLAVGAGVAGLSALYGLGGDQLRETLMDKIIPLAVTSVFVAVGAGLLSVPGIVARKKAATHTREVRATVCGKSERWSRDSDGHRSRTWVLDWKYYADGAERTYHSNTGRSPERREVGDEGTLYLNPADPDDVWEKPMAAEKALLMVMGAMFMGVGLLAMAMMLSF